MSTSGILEHLDLMEPRLTSIIACSIFNSPAHRRSTDGTVVLVYLSENSCITSALSSPCTAACVSVTSGAKDVDACYLLKPSCHCWAAIYRVLLVKSGHQADCLQTTASLNGRWAALRLTTVRFVVYWKHRPERSLIRILMIFSIYTKE
jgi:hypothetical protein